MEDTLKKVQAFLDEKNGVAEEMLNHMLERHVNLANTELIKRCQENERVNIATTFVGDPETILSFIKKTFLESTKTKYSFGDWLEHDKEYTHYEFYIPIPDYLSARGIKKLPDGSFKEVKCKWILFTCSRVTQKGNNRKIWLANGKSRIKTINAYPISEEMQTTLTGKKRRFLRLPKSSLNTLYGKNTEAL